VTRIIVKIIKQKVKISGLKINKKIDKNIIKIDSDNINCAEIKYSLKPLASL
jgi:hypothetical protein